MSTFKIISLANPMAVLAFVFFIVIVILAIYLMKKMSDLSTLKAEAESLNETLRDLDQQAKLIIKSDMELKLYQREIEDEFNKLALIKSFILSSMHILDNEKIFTQIDRKVINDLGFKRGLILGFNDLGIKVNVDFGPKEIVAVKNTLQHKKEALKTAALLDQDSEICKQLVQEINLKDTLITAVKAREQVYAIFILSDLLVSEKIKKSEGEACLILCMYLGRCLDNIELFESLYHSKDDLERKIKERTNELVKSLRAIQVANKAKSDFISSVSHELRTPLTSVKGFSSLLVDEKFGKLPPEAKERLTKIDDNVDKLMDIVNTLLDISRIESGKMEAKIAPYDIAQLAKDVTDFLSPQSQAKKISLALDFPEKVNAFLDKNLIERVLINLINNSIKFTPEGGAITVGCKKDEHAVTVSVADTGYGMEREDLEKVFQEFFRVNNPANQKIKGSGLGLSLVKRIIDTHKEKIWVESEVGKGTTFYFTLRTVE